MKHLLSVLIIAVLLAGCRSTKPSVIEVPIQYKEKIVERLVPVKINGDSLKMRAFFECDSLNQVVIKNLSEQKSKGVESNLSFDKGQLNYDAKTVHDTVYVKGKEITITRDVPIRVEIPVITNELTKWQSFQIIAFRILIALALLIVAYKMFWAKIKLLIK